MRLANLVRGLGEEFRHKVISLDDDTSAVSAFAADTISVEEFPARKSRWLRLSNIKGLVRRIRDADLLCTYNFGAIEAAIANRIGPNLPHVHFEDGFGPDETISHQKSRRVLLRRLALASVIVVVPSRGLERAAVTTWRLKRKNVRHVMNGVDIDRFAVLQRAASDKRPVVVGSVGALRSEKNYARLIRAFCEAAPRDDARLRIFGRGPERERLLALAADGKGAVELPGEISEPERAYAGFDIFALSSDTEQAPLSLLEAMASGLPVVASDVGDIREMLSEENRKFVIAPEDNRAFIEAIRLLVSDAPLRARLGAANATKARNCFRLENMVNDYRALFAEALARGR